MKEDEDRIYFFDTSALVKRYHNEHGTDIIDAAFSKDVVKLISDLSVIEFHSAFAKKARMGVITEEDFRETAKVMATDVREGVIQVVAFEEEEKEEAISLIEAYGVSKNLRTLDALQLAVMKQFGPHKITKIYCSDRRFAAAIEAEGFSVIDPEKNAGVGE